MYSKSREVLQAEVSDIDRELSFQETEYTATLKKLDSMQGKKESAEEDLRNVTKDLEESYLSEESRKVIVGLQGQLQNTLDILIGRRIPELIEEVKLLRSKIDRLKTRRSAIQKDLHTL